MKCGPESGYEWFKYTLTNIFDEKKQIIHTVGVLENIHEQKNYENMLRDRAEHDLLTGLYNRITTETMISLFLQQELVENHLHAMIVMDLDNFKTINDRCGHIAGDEVLRLSIACMQPCAKFINKHIINARPGFCPYSAALEHRYCSCSCGMTDFSEIYRRADIALYEAKNSGNNKYVLFSEKEREATKYS